MNLTDLAWTTGCNCSCAFVDVQDNKGGGTDSGNYIVGWELILLCAAIAIIFILVATLWITCNLNTFANIPNSEPPNGMTSGYENGTQQTQSMAPEETTTAERTEYREVDSNIDSHIRSTDPKSSQQTLEVNTDTHGSGTTKDSATTNSNTSGETRTQNTTEIISSKITTDKETATTRTVTSAPSTRDTHTRDGHSVRSNNTGITPSNNIPGGGMFVSLKTANDTSPVMPLDQTATSNPYHPKLSKYHSLKQLGDTKTKEKQPMSSFRKRRTGVLRTHADPSMKSKRDLINTWDDDNTRGHTSPLPHHLNKSSKSSRKLDMHNTTSNNPNHHNNNNYNSKRYLTRNTSITNSMNLLERSTQFRRHKESFPELKGEFYNVSKSHKFKTRKSHTQDDMFYDNFNDHYPSDDEYAEVPFGDDNDDYETVVPRPSISAISSAANKNLNGVRKNVSQLSVGSVGPINNNQSNDSYRTGSIRSSNDNRDNTVVVNGSVNGSSGIGDIYQAVPYPSYDHVPEEKSISHTPQPKQPKLKKEHTKPKLYGKFELSKREDFEKMSQIRVGRLQEPKKVDVKNIDWKNAQEIGHGSFGVVLRANYRGGRDDPSVVAVKKLHEKHLTSAQRKEFAREAKLMEHFGEHPHIVRFIGVCTLKDQLCIITEFAEHGSLWDCLRGKKRNEYSKRLTVEKKLEMVKQAAEGILHLHKEAVIHRDISARNFLIDSNFNIKVADLGMARLKSSHVQKLSQQQRQRQNQNNNNNNNNYNNNNNDDIYSNVDDEKNNEIDENEGDKTDNKFGPIRWLAPECIYAKDGLQYSEKTDVYAFGITLYEIFAVQRPFYEILKLAEVSFAIYNGDRPSVNDNERIQRVGPQLPTLMQECWQENPKLRPNFESIIEDLKSIRLKYMSTYRNNKEYIQAIKEKIKKIQKQQRNEFIDASPTNFQSARQTWEEMSSPKGRKGRIQRY